MKKANLKQWLVFLLIIVPLSLLLHHFSLFFEEQGFHYMLGYAAGVLIMNVILMVLVQFGKHTYSEMEKPVSSINDPVPNGLVRFAYGYALIAFIMIVPVLLIGGRY